ncbi:uncharacterized protein LOC123665736 [Melitaea cinxia]|uniref:uncharacterized protein LOC123665736 n=1 Tax=Melitaea cinxia TaxID=113334 RepID=UPI001E27223D|nr:uncharacterized protein LOC123665736 [Melitaea cinxia]
MFHCSICDESHTDGPICHICKKQYGFGCVGVTEAGFRRLGERKNTWRCPKCKASPSVSPALSIAYPDLQIPNQLDSMQEKLNDILVQLASLPILSQDLKIIKDDLSDLKQSVEMAHQRTDKLFDKVQSLEAKVKDVEKIASDIPIIQKEIARLNSELEERDQWARANNVEIKGIPQKKDENLYSLVQNIGNCVNFPIKKEDINYIARVPTRSPNMAKPIIICFNNRYMKEDLVAVARKHNLNISDIGYSSSSTFYINDHLTQHYKSLLGKAKSRAKEVGFKYIWVKHSKIMARKTDSSPVFFIKNEKDLARITQ